MRLCRLPNISGDDTESGVNDAKKVVIDDLLVFIFKEFCLNKNILLVCLYVCLFVLRTLDHHYK